MKNLTEYLIFLFFLLTFTTCKKPNIIPENPQLLKNNKIHFYIQGLEDNVEVKKLANSKTSNPKSNSAIVSSQIIDLKELDAIVSISEMLPSSNHHHSNVKIARENYTRNKSENKSKQVNPLNHGIHYRIVLYKTDQTGNPIELVDQKEGIIGNNAIALSALRNTNYRWYAYTFNNNSSISELKAKDEKIMVQPSGNNDLNRQDFAYATGLIRTSNEIGGSSSINNIILSRKSSRIIVEVNSIGMFAAVAYASPKFKEKSGLFKAEFNLRTASFENYSPISNTDNVFNEHDSGYSVPVGIDSVPEVDWKRRYTFYTTSTKNETQLQVTLDTLWIMSERLQERGGPKDFRNREFLNKTFTIPNFIPEPGKSYFISIKLLESAITIGGTQWARSNVYRVSDTPLSSDRFWNYRFRYDNPVYELMSAVPSQTDFFQNDIYDLNGKNICERIYPEGVWDLPTSSDFEQLDNFKDKGIIIKNNGWSLWITPPIPPIGAPSYPHSYLVFAPNGYKLSPDAAILEYYPNNSNYRATKGYWRTKGQSSFAQINFSRSQGSMIEMQIYPSNRNACIRCIRKKI